MFVIILVILTLAVLYWFPVRRWMGCWGTTPEEVARTMAGDAVIARPMHCATHKESKAVTASRLPHSSRCDSNIPWRMEMQNAKCKMQNDKLKCHDR